MYRDIVEVVRCKDCKHGTESRLYINPYLVCKRTERPMLGEDYCSQGERREENESKDK